eukprot:scaffold733_cov267-Pinguiococcus_pyrenoidosus.AAC.51
MLEAMRVSLSGLIEVRLGRVVCSHGVVRQGLRAEKVRALREEGLQIREKLERDLGLLLLGQHLRQEKRVDPLLLLRDALLQALRQNVPVHAKAAEIQPGAPVDRELS